MWYIYGICYTNKMYSKGLEQWLDVMRAAHVQYSKLNKHLFFSGNLLYLRLSPPIILLN